MPQVQVNKWVRLILTLLSGIMGLLAAYHWTDLVDARTAGLLVIGLSGIKGIIDLLAPPAGTPTAPVVGATSISLITHKAVKAGSAT
jgi:hypothetical protein